MTMRYVTISLVSAALLIGCLPNTYVVPEEEAQRLARTPPAERGERVRVVQEFWGTDVPADQDYVPYRAAPVVQQGQQGHVHIHTSTCFSFGGGRTCRYPLGRTRVSDGRFPVTRGGASPARPAPPVSEAPAKGFQGGGSGVDVGDAKAIAVIVIAAAALVTVGLIATEGMRYEGGVDLDPNHPVHLVQRGGGIRTLPLSELTESDVDGSSEIIVSDMQGDGFDFAGRNPLNRVGFTWRMEGGTAAMLMPDDEATYVPTVGVNLGYFPLQQLGLTFFSTVGFGDYLGTELFSIRYGLQLEVMPIALGIFHPGFYGNIGMTFAAMDEGTFPDHSYHVMRVTTGGQIEFDLTTRLSVTARVGAFWEEHRQGFTLPGVEASFGVAIY